MAQWDTFMLQCVIGIDVLTRPYFLYKHMKSTLIIKDSFGIANHYERCCFISSLIGIYPKLICVLLGYFYLIIRKLKHV